MKYTSGIELSIDENISNLMDRKEVNIFDIETIIISILKGQNSKIKILIDE